VARLFPLIALLVVAACPPEARAQSTSTKPKLPDHSVHYQAGTGVIYNQLGGALLADLAYRMQIVDEPGILWWDTYLDTRLKVIVSPTFVRFGPALYLQPVAFLKLGGGYLFNRHFGVLGSLASFPNAAVEHDDARLAELADEGATYAASRHHLFADVELRARFGDVGFKNLTRGTYYSAELRNGDTVFYSKGLDLLVPNEGRTLSNQTDLVYFWREQWIVGLHLSIAHPFYTSRHAPAPEQPTRLRIGPEVAWIAYDEAGAAINRPTVFSTLGWWVLHPYRTGASVHAAIPFAMLAFRIEGELWRNE